MNPNDALYTLVFDTCDSLRWDADKDADALAEPDLSGLQHKVDALCITLNHVSELYEADPQGCVGACKRCIKEMADYIGLDTPHLMLGEG